MSIYTTETYACPNCGTIYEYNHFASINADRRPDLREEIISGTLELITCEPCELDIRPEPSFNYLDYANGLWIMALPLPDIARWDQEEKRAEELFSRAYGAQAPASAPKIGNQLSPRITFGWPALREKLVLKEADLDDLLSEKTKIAVLYNRLGNPVEPGVELRFFNAMETEFRMGWVDGESGKILQAFDIQRALYESTSEGDGWFELDSKIGAGMFVDMQRMFIDPESKLDVEELE